MSEKIELRELAIKLQKLGYHIVPTDREKRPLTKWRERLPKEELEKTLEKAHSIALVCGNQHPMGNKYTLISIDVDNPTLLGVSVILGKLLNNSMHVLTGPRCPLCGEKHLEVIEEGKTFKCSKCNIEFNSERASRGFAIFVFVENHIVEKYFGGTKREYKDVEFLVNNYQVIAGKHPTGIDYELRKINLNSPDLGITVISENYLIELLNEIEKYRELKSRTEKKEIKEKKEREETIELRVLKEEEINQAIALLKDVYKPGVRQNIWLYFSGWSAKARIDYLSTTKVLFTLYKDCNDTDSLKMRLAAIVYSYEKTGIKVDKQKIKEITGEEPYGSEVINEENIKGKTGLYEIFVSILNNEEEAMDRIRRLEEILGPSPFTDLIMKILNYEKKIFAVADLRKNRIVLAKLVSDGERTKLKITDEVVVGTITELKILIDPFTNEKKYIFKFKHPELQEIEYGPVTSEEFISFLKRNNYVVYNRKVEDVISAVINGFIKKGRAEIISKIEPPGFYLIESNGSKTIFVNEYEVKPPSKEELREALDFLDYIVNKYFNDVLEQFSTAIKWHAIAPFSYVIKQLRNHIPYLYLFGPPNTRKTTINLIGIHLYGFKYRDIPSQDIEIPGASANTEATLGNWLSKGTFPVCIKEPGLIFDNPSLVELLKASVESHIARGRFRGGRYVETPALAPLAFSSNQYIPRDESLYEKRIYVIEFSMDQALDLKNEEVVKKVKEFESEVKPNLDKLKPIGQFISHYIINNPNILEGATWVNATWIDIAEKLFEECYKYVEKEIPEWIKKRYKSKTFSDYKEEIKDLITGVMLKEINDAYSRYIKQNPDLIESAETDLKERIKVVGQKHLCEWFFVKEDSITKEYVVYISSLLEEKLRERLKINHKLKSIAQLFDWEYELTTVKFKGKALRKYYAIVNLNEFVKLFVPDFEQSTQSNQQTSQTIQINEI
jgi:hypothetical protein